MLPVRELEPFRDEIRYFHAHILDFFPLEIDSFLAKLEILPTKLEIFKYKNLRFLLRGIDSLSH